MNARVTKAAPVAWTVALAATLLGGALAAEDNPGPPEVPPPPEPPAPDGGVEEAVPDGVIGDASPGDDELPTGEEVLESTDAGDEEWIVRHEPVRRAAWGMPLGIYVRVNPDAGVDRASIYLLFPGGGPFKVLPMVNKGALWGAWLGCEELADLTSPRFQYFVELYGPDDAVIERVGTPAAPIEVLLSPPSRFEGPQPTLPGIVVEKRCPVRRPLLEDDGREPRPSDGLPRYKRQFTVAFTPLRWSSELGDVGGEAEFDFTPGADLTYLGYVGRYFGLSAGVSLFEHWDYTFFRTYGGAHAILPLARDHIQLSLGLRTGLALLEEIPGGTAAGVFGFRGYFNRWGIAVDVLAGMDGFEAATPMISVGSAWRI
jgi:hypothetical protein